ncbi:MAG: hypothetical protein LBQ83_00790 [Candidatus Margulisbacteria bacterium]|jgi:hypothetical protein|nr:hypothetical protein [Candidatus Margulisiibacteriota bacterium]
MKKVLVMAGLVFSFVCGTLLGVLDNYTVDGRHYVNLPDRDLIVVGDVIYSNSANNDLQGMWRRL